MFNVLRKIEMFNIPDDIWLQTFDCMEVVWFRRL